MKALHRNVLVLWGGRALAAAIVVAGLTVALDQQWMAPGYVTGAVFGVGIGVVGCWHAVRLYGTWRFDTRAESLYLERGVLVRVETDVPYVRIQHVDTRRNPLERAVGLSKVVVYTAGSRGADIVVPGLRPQRAEALHDELRELSTEGATNNGV